MRLLLFLLRYFRAFWAWGILALVATLVYAAATVFLLQLIEPILSDVLGVKSGEISAMVPGAVASSLAAPPPHGDSSAPAGALPGAAQRGRVFLDRYLTQSYARLRDGMGIRADQNAIFLPVLFVVIFLLRSGSDFLNGYAFQRLGLGATTELRNDLYRRTLDQSSRFHADHPSGELASRVVNDIAVLQGAITTRLVDLFQQTVTLLGLLALLVSIHLRYALFCLIAAPAILYPIVRFSRGMRRSSHRSQERTADLANLVNESARGHRVVKAFGMEGFEAERFRVATERHLRANLRAQLLSNLSSPVVESLGVIGAGIFLVFAGRAIHSGAMSSAVLVKFLFVLFAMYDPIRRINKANLIVQQSIAAAQRIRSLMDLPVEIEDRADAREKSELEREIRFEHVSFRYDHKEVLKGVSFAVRRDQVVALVGPSGGGKTTIVNLLPRFFDVSEGVVTIDGVDVRELRLSSLRSLIGLVTQETTLFNDTVRENIAYGRADLPIEHVREAAIAAYADEFIRELPRGYDTRVGEGGVRLSGGQRQRIAIARALLKNAPILILDEATSQLDTEAEVLVQKALANLVAGRTTLVVAHRLSTVRRADRILVVDAGEIVEEGTHDELLVRDGTYRRLYDLQFPD